MFCSNCGQKVPDDAVYCSSCGSCVSGEHGRSSRDNGSASSRSSVVLVGDYNLYAIIALLCSVASCSSLSLMLLVATILFGSIARKQFKEHHDGAGRGASMVIVAYVIVGVGIVLRIMLGLFMTSAVGALISYVQTLAQYSGSLGHY